MRIRQRMVRRIGGLLAVCSLIMAGCGGGDESQALHWSFFKQVGPHKAKLAGEVGYCVGEPKPRVEKVLRSYSGNRVFLTLILTQERPEPEECRAIGLGVFRTVRFKRNLGQLELFDSSIEPPRRRWPAK